MLQQKNIGIFLFFILLVNILPAQNRLLSPEEFLPSSYGKHFTPHHLLVDYYEHVAANSEQVKVQMYGRTNQRRPLLYTILTSKKNFARLEEIRQNNLRRTGLEEGSVTDDNIAIVWLSFGVHGNEAGASESALATLYDLAKPDNTTAQKWLENTVVIIDPAINPDGFSRYTHWNWNIGNHLPNPLTEAAEHHEPWPGGRVNHYLFDLNRDWAWQTQVESQQRLKIYHQWMPHIHVDFHEQYHNDPYYFAPAAQPFHAYITQWQGDFQTTIGKNNAKYFDEKGWLYYTREIFDLFYPSYGDTYPTFNGAIGMTYEQGGHSLAGRAILLENGDTLQLIDRITHHKTTALSTVEVASQNAKQLTAQFADYFKTSKANPSGEYETFVVKASNGKDKIQFLCDFLDSHHISYGLAGKGQTVRSAFNYRTGTTGSMNLAADDLVINAHQPISILTQVLFEPEPFLVDSLTYDITAWALPYAYGLDAYALKTDLKPTKEYVAKSFAKYDLNADKAYAYLVDWNGLEDAQFLNALQEKNVSVKTASVDFGLEGDNFSAGTLIINRGDNRKLGKSFDRIVLETANEMKATLRPVMTGFSSNGKDLGSDKMKLLKKPQIMIVGGKGTDPNSFGYLWHFFDQELKFQVTNVYTNDFGRTSLEDYNVLVMADGSYPDMDSTAMAKITDWVRGGGKLIALGSAVSKLSRHADFKIQRKKNSISSAGKKDAPKRTHYAGQERRSITNAMPGAIYKIKLDNTHPLAYGLPEYYHTLKTSRAAYQYLDSGWNVGYVGEDPQITGFVGFEAKKKLEETSVFGVQNLGRGKVVYMVDNPLFRGFWRQGKFIFVNAIFLL